MTDVRPVTDIAELAALFGDRGAYAGCWCMWWRMRSKDFDAAGNAGRRAGMAELLAGGCMPGLIAYDAEEPLGWVSVGPRAEFGRVERSPALRPRLESDAEADELTWAVTCFWVPRAHRGRGLARALLDGAVAYAADQGATVIEGYPVPDGSGAEDAFTGVPALFSAAGFTPVGPPRGKRTVWRRPL